MTLLEAELALVAASAFITSVYFLYYLIDRSRRRLAYLKAANKKSKEFYDLAESVLRDPDLPEPLREMVQDATIAVTDRRVGRVAIQSLIKSIAEMNHKGRFETPPRYLMDQISDLKRNKIDLYEAFIQTLRTGMAAISLIHIDEFERSLATFGYDAVTGPQAKLLSLAQSIHQATVEWRDSDGNTPVACFAN